MVDQSYNVRTGLKTISNVYSGLGTSQCFYINNIEASGLYFEKGKNYQFIQTNISNIGNPLNIYLDEYGNKKLEKYITISGSAGLNRYLTVSIPKTFKQTNTLYYGNESGQFFGAPIKLTSTEYYLKHNIQLYCFNAYHDNTKYIIPDNILTQNAKFYNEFILISGILPFINKNNDLFKSNYLSNVRTDVIKINAYVPNKGIMPDDSLNLNFFGNNLYYKNIKTDATNQWSNLYDLYNLIIDLSFADSGSLESGTQSSAKYYQYGYRLSGCEGCIDKITLTTGFNNFYSGQITLFYNPRKIYENYRSYPLMNVNGESFNSGDFVGPNTIIAEENFKYTKYTGAQAYYA
jgi:hypothetical protein